MKRNTYRINDMEKKLKIARFRPLDVMVTGVTGAGKSTTLNSLFEKTVAEVGDGCDPQTMELDSYCLNDVFRLWDTPGLGDGVERDKIHEKKLIDLLYMDYYLDSNQYGFIDIVLVIIEGTNRDMGTTYHLLNNVILPNFPSNRVLVAINQADVAMKGRHWDSRKNRPDEILTEYLEEQAKSIQKRIKEATGIMIKSPVYYSAEKDYNVTKLMDLIVENMPTCRREF